MKTIEVDRAFGLELREAPLPAIAEWPSGLPAPAAILSGGAVALRDVFPGLAEFRETEQRRAIARQERFLAREQARAAWRERRALAKQKAREMKEKARARWQAVVNTD